MTTDEQGIEACLKGYNKALADSDTGAVVKLYAPDGVFMPQNFPTVVGTTAIRTMYDNIFKKIQLTVKFDIIETVVASSEWAFARTSSSGVQKDLESGKTSHEGNQELFVMQKIDDEWVIARYCFCTTNPPK